MWHDNLKVGDTIAYDINEFGIKTGEIKEVVVTELFLSQIRKFETKDNIHNMRIVKTS